MTPEQRQACEWALKQNFGSVSARYAKILALYILELEKKLAARARYDAAIEKKSDYDKTLLALTGDAK